MSAGSFPTIAVGDFAVTADRLVAPLGRVALDLRLAVRMHPDPHQAIRPAARRPLAHEERGLDDVTVEGIRSVTAEDIREAHASGCEIKLLAIAQRREDEHEPAEGADHDRCAVGQAAAQRVRGQQLRHVHARAALDDLDVQPALLIGPAGQGLIEAALFGLGAPVGGETQPHPALFVDRSLGPPAGPKPDRPRRHGRPVQRPRRGAADPGDVDLVPLKQPVEHAPGKGPVRAAALQGQVDGFGGGITHAFSEPQADEKF